MQRKLLHYHEHSLLSTASVALMDIENKEKNLARSSARKSLSPFDKSRVMAHPTYLTEKTRTKGHVDFQ